MVSAQLFTIALGIGPSVQSFRSSRKLPDGNLGIACTIIEILVLYWGSKRVIVSLKRNDPKSRPHAVPANAAWQYFSKI